MKADALHRPWRLRDQVGLLLRVSRSHGIARRNRVVNAFDGASTMPGLCTGLLLSGGVAIPVVPHARLAAAIAATFAGMFGPGLFPMAEP